MKNTILLLVCLLAFSSLKAQTPDLSAEDVAAHTYRFTIQNGKMGGPGADRLLSEIEGSQFFMLGEYHGESGISAFTQVLLPILKKEGYDHFAVEVGPYSAEKLSEMAKQRNTMDAMEQFYTENYTDTYHAAIPFFGGVEDVAFLEDSHREGYDLWGLDQEYLGGYLFLLDLLWEKTGKPEKLHYRYEKVRDEIKEYYAMNKADETIEVYDQMMESEALQQLLDEFSEYHCQAAGMVEEIRSSCQIYHDWTHDRLANLEGRNDLIKKHFRDYYYQQNQRTPKVFVKMGGIHTRRGWTYNACHELGNMLHELANMNGTHDVNVAFATRYYWDDEEQTIGDNLEFESEWVTNMTPLLAQGDKEEWKLIDLRPLRKLWINRERKMTPEIKNYLRGNDFVIIMPPLPETTPLSDLGQ